MRRTDETRVNGASTIDVLIRAKKLLNSHPKAWIKWQGFGDGEHEPTGPLDLYAQPSPENARSFCALGAVYRAAGGWCKDAETKLSLAAKEVADAMHRPLDMRGEAYGRHPAAHFNNTSNSLEEVNQMFCKAIELAAEEEVNGTEG